jgi:hypothetical protein
VVVSVAIMNKTEVLKFQAPATRYSTIGDWKCTDVVSNVLGIVTIA